MGRLYFIVALLCFLFQGEFIYPNDNCSVQFESEKQSFVDNPGRPPLFYRQSDEFSSLENFSLSPVEEVALEPYLSDCKEYPLFIEAFEDGDWKSAKNRLSTVTDTCNIPPEVARSLRYLDGLILFRKGDVQEAGNLLETTDFIDHPFEPLVLFIRSQAATKEKKHKKTIKLQRQFLGHDYLGKLTYNIVFNIAKEELEKNQKEAAIQRLRSFCQTLSNRKLYRRALLDSGKLFARYGYNKEAAHYFIKLLREYPKSKLARQADQELFELERIGKVVFHPDDTERIGRAMEISESSSSKGIAVLQEIATRQGLNSKTRKAWEQIAKARRFISRKRYSKALKMLKKANKFIKPGLMEPHFLLAKAEALRKLDKDRQAIELYLKIAEEYTWVSFAGDALYQASRLAGYLEQPAEAEGYLRQLVFSSSLRSPHAKGMWEYFWYRYLAHDCDEGLKILDMILEQAGDETDRSGLTYYEKALYWKARCILKSEQTDQALDLFKHIIRRYPHTYYAIFSEQWVDMLIDPKILSEGHPIPDPPCLAHPDQPDLELQTFFPHQQMKVPYEFFKLGLIDEAVIELYAGLRYNNAPSEAGTLISYLAFKKGQIGKSIYYAARFGALDVAPYEGNIFQWRLAYPTTYWENISGYSADLGISPWLVFGVIRQESNFRRKAVSRVGARGLMQLMPGTAKVTAKRMLNIKAPKKNKLFDPKTNIQLGTRYLEELLWFLKGNLPMAVAGYNAGPGSVRKWHRNTDVIWTDEFVESMRFRGTCGYTKKVLGSFSAYHGLYGTGKRPWIPMQVPSELGSWGNRPQIKPDNE